jgi:hypothetical protein
VPLIDRERDGWIASEQGQKIERKLATAGS